jgi:hypothetical protein
MNVAELSEEQLRRNYEAHLDRITNGREVIWPDFMAQFMQLEVTHTFGESVYERIFLNSNKDHSGLLSHEYRRNHGLSNSRKPMGHAGLFGLDSFVFAYLGSHEPYYANIDTDPAFGVFISRRLESDNSSNATRRDLASPEISNKSQREIEKEFMLPEDARKIIALEIETVHRGDIWSYWGNPSADLSSMWKAKAEMHFLERVRVSDIRGIIWPNKTVYSFYGYDNSKLTGEKQEFVRLYPHIHIYDYPWTPASGSRAFVNASCSVSRYFFINNKYPQSQMYEYKDR